MQSLQYKELLTFLGSIKNVQKINFMSHPLTIAKISALHPFIDTIKEWSCNVEWQQTLSETRKLFCKHLQLLHSAADPIHCQNHVQVGPTRSESWARLAEKDFV